MTPEEVARANAFTAAKEQFLLEGQKALLIINGGGAVALAGFLQAIWDKAPALRSYVLAGILLTSVGLVIGALVPHFRHIAFVKGHSKPDQLWYRLGHRIAPFTSIALFFAAMCCVVVGGYVAIR